MTILLYDDGKLLVDDGNPLPVSITEPENRDILVYDGYSGKWVNVHQTN